ncbi:hypothetical protein RHGRI_032591 [Rhododendron griersonianum]|uniref:protein-serine/threonine phosphatase n=1 Tax=Rhododendron griersonianum TaxID=479676 RepID=A0AAV6ID18_9ERIC|nr:hypothetical protein RHGRI_032591 [Rhododendron griersonianum]
MLRSCYRPLERCLGLWSGDGLLWHKDLKPHASGDFSIAVVQANSTLEDQSQVFTSPSTTYVGVYDGHGGPEASRFISQHLFPYLHQFSSEHGGLSSEVIKKAFSATEEDFVHLVKRSFPVRPKIASVGSCCLVGMISDGVLYVANLGDSRAVLGCRVSVGQTSRVVAQRLSTDHNVASEEVRKEVEALHPDDAAIVVNCRGVWRIKGIIQLSLNNFAVLLFIKLCFALYTGLLQAQIHTLHLIINWIDADLKPSTVKDLTGIFSCIAGGKCQRRFVGVLNLVFDIKDFVWHHVLGQICSNGAKLFLIFQDANAQSPGPPSHAAEVSRSIGDVYLKKPELNRDPIFQQLGNPLYLRRPVLTAEPSILKRKLKPEDIFLIFASDGLWEHLSDEAAIEIVFKNPRSGIAKRLVGAALQEAAKKREMRYKDIKKIEKGVRRHFHDDITVVVVYLDHQNSSTSGRFKRSAAGYTTAPVDIFSNPD